MQTDKEAMRAGGPKEGVRLGRLVLVSTLFLGIVAGLSVLGWILLIPPPARPKMAIHLNGYKTNEIGKRLGIVSLTNLSSATIFAYMPLTQIHNETNALILENVAGAPWSATLRPMESATFAMPAPTNDVAWALHLYVYSDFDFARTMKRYLTLRRQHPFFIESEWFAPSKSQP